MTPDFDPTKPAQTEAGEKVQIIYWDKKRIVAFVGADDVAATFRPNGTSLNGLAADSLINVPEVQRVWLNVHRLEGDLFRTAIHKTRESADAATSPGDTRVSRIAIELKEGVWDE
jgi:hypothetical protein